MTLPTITNKQQSILILIYRFRFLNRTQIQTILKHKYHKRIIDWLNDLYKKEYLGRIYSKKLSENIKPAVYYVSTNGIKHLRKLEFPDEQIKKLYREKERSENFISKYILLADICLDLQSKSNEKLRFAALTASDFANPASKHNFLVELGPDLVYMKEERSMKRYYLLKILEPTLPLYSIRKKIKNYFDFYFSNSWEDNTKENFPTILVVCPTLAMLIDIKRFSKKLLSEYDDIDLRIKFSELKEVSEKGITGDIWE